MFSNPSESIPCFFIFWLVFENNSDCSASRGTRRATAVYVIQFTREPARPASREARCRAAVTPQPTGFPSSSPALYGRGMGCRGTTPAREPRGPSPSGGNSAANPLSHEQPRALWARCGVKGGERKRVPSGHNRRRRLATGSRQPKRGFGTAVPKTTIEVADHCPCLR